MLLSVKGVLESRRHLRQRTKFLPRLRTRAQVWQVFLRSLPGIEPILLVRFAFLAFLY